MEYSIADDSPTFLFQVKSGMEEPIPAIRDMDEDSEQYSNWYLFLFFPTHRLVARLSSEQTAKPEWATSNPPPPGWYNRSLFYMSTETTSQAVIPPPDGEEDKTTIDLPVASVAMNRFRVSAYACSSTGGTVIWITYHGMVYSEAKIWINRKFRPFATLSMSEQITQVAVSASANSEGHKYVAVAIMSASGTLYLVRRLRTHEGKWGKAVLQTLDRTPEGHSFLVHARLMVSVKYERVVVPCYVTDASLRHYVAIPFSEFGIGPFSYREDIVRVDDDPEARFLRHQFENRKITKDELRRHLDQAKLSQYFRQIAEPK